jgi:outer membrane protein OmpA-like peptidoglycan-associated protein
LPAQSTYIIGSSENNRLANDAGLSGQYFASADDIAEGSNVILLGNIYTAPDHGPLYDLQQRNCRVIRLAGKDAADLTARIKAYNDYIQPGKSVFADIPPGLGNVNQPVLFPVLEAVELKQPNRNNTNLDFVPKPIFNTQPAPEPDYVPPSMAEFAATGRIALHFEYGPNETAVPADARSMLNDVALVLKVNPQMKIRVEGHTDNYLDSDHNLNLSKQRASNIREWLVNSGISADRIKAAGYGESRPVGDNNTSAGRAANRRVEIVKD